MRLATAACLIAAAVLAGCGSDDLEASCDGEYVDDCAPYTYAVVSNASVDPGMIMPGDPTPEARAHVRVELRTCGADAPGNHRVIMQARTTGSGLVDAGATERVIELDVLRDDGMTDGDDTAKDGVIDVMVANPFFDLPEERTVTLRFVPQLMSCLGRAYETEYTTGSQWSPDAGL